MTIKTLSVNIPFMGFYETLYSRAIDDEQEQYIENYIEYRQAEEGIPQELRITADELNDIMFDVTTYRDAYQAIAQTYVGAFESYLSELVGFKVPMAFEEMTSPKFYNFETDRLFANIPYTRLARLFLLSKRENHERLKACIEERCTSRSGFHSYYSNELDDWLEKPLSQWDHNELCILITSFLPDDWEWEVYNIASEHSFYEEWECAVDWGKLDERVELLRHEKEEELKAFDPDYIPPEPRCPYTLDMFAGA